MGINVINPIAPQQFIWLVKIVGDAQTGGKIIIMGAKVQRNITANVGIDKILKADGSVGKKLSTSQKFIRTIVK